MKTTNQKLQEYIIANGLKNGDVVIYRADICQIEHIEKFINSDMLASEINAIDKVADATFLDIYFINNAFEAVHVDTFITYIRDAELYDEKLTDLLNIEFLSVQKYKFDCIHDGFTFDVYATNETELLDNNVITEFTRLPKIDG